LSHGPRASLRLPLEFDRQRLQADLARIARAEFVTHFNADYHEGDWSAAPLRSVGGLAGHIFPDPAAKASFADTPLLARCPYLQEVLAAFRCPVLSARLLRLGPGAAIHEHRDADLGRDVGEIRVHVPVTTNPQAAFFLDGRRVTMREGECWYLDFSLPHRAANRGTTDRVHLILDLVVNGWLTGILEAGTEEPASPGDPGEASVEDGTGGPSNLERFRARALQDAALAHRLLEIEDTETFISTAGREAAAAGMPLEPRDLEAGLRRRAPVGATDDAGLPGALADWTPIKVESGPRWSVEWCHLGGRRLTEPFFEDTVAQRKNRPFNRWLRPRTSLGALAARRDAPPGLAPSGFVFHVSRCGSTLVSRMLAALDRAIVVSEAPPIDSVLRAGGHDPRVSDDDRVRWLREIVRALSQPRNGERHFFVKFDAWSALDLPVVARAFPDVPWVFLYRDPIEVLLSHARRRGRHMVPGLLEPALFGLAATDLPGMSIDEYGARVLAAIGQAALDHRAGRSMFVSYRDLPDAVVSSLAPFFGIDLGAEDRERMREVARLDAKDPARPFSGPHAAAPTPAILQAAARWASPVFERLKSRRLLDARS
jgi:gluconate kinase